jgi:tRNA-specific 2-thiouridylase
LATARDLGADALATGHYIRSRANPTEENPGRRALYRPVDNNRDQSYFLFATTQDQLDYVRFPLGDLPKSDTRALAEEMGLVVAQKADSQDICFVPQGKYSSIVEKLRPDAVLTGDIVHLDGRVLGTHDGILRYTIGQRRGIGVSAGEPLYVVYIDARTSRVIVGPKEALETKSVTLRDVNWLGDEPLDAIGPDGFECFAKVRSTRPPKPARVTHIDGVTNVELIDGEEGVAAGQACVLYSSPDDNARVYGGGFIKKSLRDPKTEQMLQELNERSPLENTAASA